MDGSGYDKKFFNTAKRLIPYLEFELNVERSVGFSNAMKLESMCISSV